MCMKKKNKINEKGEKNNKRVFRLQRNTLLLLLLIIILKNLNDAQREINKDAPFNDIWLRLVLICSFEKIFKNVPIYFFGKFSTPLRAPVLVQRSQIKNLESIIWQCLHSNITNFSIVVLEKSFRHFPYISMLNFELRLGP